MTWRVEDFSLRGLKFLLLENESKVLPGLVQVCWFFATQLGDKALVDSKTEAASAPAEADDLDRSPDAARVGPAVCS